jgi:hypothetical protein
MKFKRIGNHIFIVRKEYYGSENNWSEYSEDITELILGFIPVATSFFALGILVAKFWIR